MKCNFFRNSIWLNYLLVNNIIKALTTFNVLSESASEASNPVCSPVNDSQDPCKSYDIIHMKSMYLKHHEIH